MRNLHVCWQNGTAHNCGRCEKCVRTLLTLELLGVREKAASFPPVRFSLDAVRGLRLGSMGAEQVMAELAPHARRLGRADVAAAIEDCLQKNRRLNSAAARSPVRRLKQGVRQNLARLLSTASRFAF